MAMRLITRSDFDGLACGALLLSAGIVDNWVFAHPKDIQDGLVPVTENDCLANVPFVEGCGLWFDHHASEEERNKFKGKYKGESRITPSCARISSSSPARSLRPSTSVATAGCNRCCSSRCAACPASRRAGSPACPPVRATWAATTGRSSISRAAAGSLRIALRAAARIARARRSAGISISAISIPTAWRPTAAT